jgi:glutamate/tyrosine decarboxylase-like PLP-dependent enzyme
LKHLTEKNPLGLSKDKMQAIGYAVIDMIVEHLDAQDHTKVHGQASPEYLNEKLGGPLPLKGQDPFDLMKELKEDVFSNILQVDHPRFYSFIPSPGNFISVMADTLATGYNVFAGHWLAGSSAASVERITINWLKEICNFPQAAGGLFVSGGSMANLSAIATARKIKLGDEDKRGVVYYSHQTHSSLSKGLRVLGIGKKYQRPLPTDTSLKIDLSQLEKEIKKDLKKGLTPLCIVGNAGTTNAGVVDPLDKMAEIAEKYNCWFHIDGAYGAAAMLCKKGKKTLKGLEKADSLTLDPHKWWFQSMEIGCLLVRDAKHLFETYRVSAEYLTDTENVESSKINYYDYGIQLTRSFRALKLYLSLKTFGLKAFKKAVKKGIKMADYVETLLGKKENWKIITPAQLGIINFLYAPTGFSSEELSILSRKISEKVVEDGYSMIITTQIYGQTVLRICPIHPGLTKKDMRESIKRLDYFAKIAAAEFNAER